MGRSVVLPPDSKGVSTSHFQLLIETKSLVCLGFRLWLNTTRLDLLEVKLQEDKIPKGKFWKFCDLINFSIKWKFKDYTFAVNGWAPKAEENLLNFAEYFYFYLEFLIWIKTWIFISSFSYSRFSLYLTSVNKHVKISENLLCDWLALSNFRSDTLFCKNICTARQFR